MTDRFLSHWAHGIDSKGRVSVPASFRQVLAAKGIRDLFAVQAFDRPAIDVGGPERLERLEAQMDGMSPFSQAYADLALFAHGDGKFLKYDAEGRIGVTDFIRSHTGITDQVVFVGARDHFQLWEPARFELYRTEVRERLRAGSMGPAPTRRTPE